MNSGPSVTDKHYELGQLMLIGLFSNKELKNFIGLRQSPFTQGIDYFKLELILYSKWEVPLVGGNTYPLSKLFKGSQNSLV